MARYWCNQCEIVNSSKHKNSVQRSISKLHQKNKNIHKEKVEAEREQRKLNKELGIKSDYKPEFKKKIKKDEEVNEEEEEDTKESDEPNIGEWSVVEKEDTTSNKPTLAEHSTVPNKPKKQLSTADLETKNWNLTKSKQIDLSDSDDDTKKKPTLFKKRKLKT
ncbi:hypothetical protein BN7_1755 [Wickerhamomyces ciferrii]|uniref:Uncharacterized protein n=1 Tax=Wickerhamomyces ciferrii (strain ATCC 14091 / BCRC 22168 / CBS 111 / JCM 3599 / NBRC 0793 / NRRL Y-1031 F-60-10) TaxID=1206466 RepID=K0KGV6_WICCF|nr:uncharacterized protein BN7_1755 [Wickerhamomyces ciferrii]CCH42211.1 hypothetical protein BN7_1755 [Wickerhamomyces ciferrii]